jgi:polysaccharide export outer membrane protein
VKNNIIIILLATIIAGCVPQRDLLYVQSEAEKHTAVYNNKIEETVIKAYDELYVEVGSFDSGNFNFINNDASRSSGGRSPADLALMSYTVNKEGEINLPLIGFIGVKDLTTLQASIIIQKELEGYLTSPTVKVSFVNKNITILGMVKTPGRYNYVNDHINIFQALGMAGDIEEYGNRKAIIILREENGRIERFRIDVTKDNILADNNFYLKSNDVVYVEPLKRRHWGVQTFPWALTLSSITTFILVLNYIKK